MKSSEAPLNDEPEVKLNIHSDGIIQFKIVYWGPGESGKTTNFMRLKEKFHHTKLTDGYSIETTEGRTLWQDSVFLFCQEKYSSLQFLNRNCLNQSPGVCDLPA